MGRTANTWRLNNMVLNTHWVKEVKEEIKRYTETSENENTTCQNLGHAAKTAPRGSVTGQPQETRKTPNKQSYTLKKHKRKNKQSL